MAQAETHTSSTTMEVSRLCTRREIRDRSRATFFHLLKVARLSILTLWLRWCQSVTWPTELAVTFTFTQMTEEQLLRASKRWETQLPFFKEVLEDTSGMAITYNAISDRSKWLTCIRSNTALMQRIRTKDHYNKQENTIERATASFKRSLINFSQTMLH